MPYFHRRGNKYRKVEMHIATESQRISIGVIYGRD
jgi:hypothetical protein